MDASMQQIIDENRSLLRSYVRNWCSEHFMQAARLPSRVTRILHNRRRKIFEKLMKNLSKHPRIVVPIERKKNLRADEFAEQHLQTNTPVILQGAAKHWPCVQDWTLKKLAKRYADEPIRLLRSSPGENPTPGTGELITFAEVVRRMEAGQKPYVRFSSLINNNPELIDEFDDQWFLSMRGNDVKGYGNYGLFMGGKGTATGLHSAMAPNLFVQIYGRRRWLIYPAVFAPFFQPLVKASPFFYSQVDALDQDLAAIVQHLPVYDSELDRGDVLFNPAFFWHQVHNLTDSIGVGYRWTDMKQAAKASWPQTLITMTATNPPVWTLRHQKDFPTVVDKRTKS